MSYLCCLLVFPQNIVYSLCVFEIQYSLIFLQINIKYNVYMYFCTYFEGMTSCWEVCECNMLMQSQAKLCDCSTWIHDCTADFILL